MNLISFVIVLQAQCVPGMSKIWLEPDKPSMSIYIGDNASPRVVWLTFELKL